jgi:PAS domain S-box-containing protein
MKTELLDVQGRPEAIFQHALDAILLLDDQARYVDANPSACALLGYTRDELVQLTASDVTPPANHELLREIWGQFIETGQSSGPYTLQRKDGTLIEVDYRAVARIRPGLHLCIMHDVTGRKHVEDDLIRQKEILQKIFDHLPSMINFVGADGRFILVNRSWERTLGWTLAEIQEPGFDVLAACYPDPATCERVVKFLAEARGEWADFKPRLRDGRVIDTTWAVVRLSDGTVIGIGQDITARKQAEEEQARLLGELRIANEQLQHLTRRVIAVQEEERRRIARELHDEAAQALTAMKIILQGVEEELPDSLAGPHRDLQNVIDLTDTTMEQIRRLAQDLRPSSLDTLSLNRSLEGLCEEFGKRTGLIIEYAGLELMPQPDEVNVCLYRVLQEALTNVLKHAAANRVRVDLQCDAKVLRLTVADDGMGLISPASGSPATVAGGLGLIGMRERLQLVRGSLEMISAPGQGMRLVARIPPAESV